mgnify:CR=1 FL=1
MGVHRPSGSCLVRLPSLTLAANHEQVRAETGQEVGEARYVSFKLSCLEMRLVRYAVADINNEGEIKPAVRALPYKQQRVNEGTKEVTIAPLVHAGTNATRTK